MDALDKDILTTTDAARILGVSVRTVQLLVEGGSIPSWKTPGGHRRVYRRDVLAMLPGASPEPPFASARVVLIARPDRLADYSAALAGAPSCRVDAYADAYPALLAIGARPPAAVVIEAERPDGDDGAILDSLLSDPALRDTQVLVVGGPAIRPGEMARTRFVEGLPELAEAVEAAVAGVGDQLPGLEVPPLFPIADNEPQRLLALERSGLVDTAPEDAFDRLTWLAARTLDTPISLISLLTPTRQWFKSRHGTEMAEAPRELAFCNHTILQKDVLVAPDLAADPRFAANSAVTGEQGFRFYAGCPVVDPDGFALGSLCVIDTRPRTLDATQKEILAHLAALASDEIRLRATDRQLRRAHDALGRKDA